MINKNVIDNIDNGVVLCLPIKKQKLESKIATIISKMELEGIRKKEERIEREKCQKIREEEILIETEIRERKEKELRKFVDAFKNAVQLHHATILRNYINNIEEKINNNDGKLIEDKDWIQWAKEKVDWYDPIVSTDDPLLDGSHKMAAFNAFLSLSK